MAKLLAGTFPANPEGAALLHKVKKALRRLTGMTEPKNGDWTWPPARLDADRDMLKPNWKMTWRMCVIRYDPAEKGASALHGTLTIGPFFLHDRFSTRDIEKVVLHEFLHEVLSTDWRDVHHSLINQIIQFNLEYPGPPNPAEGLM